MHVCITGNLPISSSVNEIPIILSWLLSLASVYKEGIRLGCLSQRGSRTGGRLHCRNRVLTHAQADTKTWSTCKWSFRNAYFGRFRLPASVHLSLEPNGVFSVLSGSSTGRLRHLQHVSSFSLLLNTNKAYEPPRIMGEPIPYFNVRHISCQHRATFSESGR